MTDHHINELIEQSYVEVPHERDWHGISKVFDPRKFAELIIRECSRVAFESDLKMAIGQWGADSAILKHFGLNDGV